MTTMQMRAIEGGWDWADFTCGAAIGVAAITGAVIAAGTAGTGTAAGFAVAYSIAVPACGVGALT